MDHIIGIDSGTSGIKAVLFDVGGNEVDKESYALTGICLRENYYEEDMHEIWECAKKALKKVLHRNQDKNIVGIGITAQGDGLWMIDEKGEPVRNGCCFCDGRAEAIVERWVKDGVCDALFDLTGTRIFTGNQNGIVKWMEENEPDSLRKAKYLLHLKDYLFYKLTDLVTTDATDQSLIFLDLDTGTYLDEAFSVCGLEQWKDKYPQIRKSKENKAYLKQELMDDLGLETPVLVTNGPMDVAACALGSGVIEEGNCCSIIGTAALHEMVIGKPFQDQIRVGMTITHVVESRWLRLMASLAGTPNIEWMLNTFGKAIKEEAKAKGESPYSYMEKMVESVPIGSRGVMFHPYLLAGGERAPFTDSRARASYTGISARHRLEDIVRATYEGVTFAMMDCYKHMPLEVKQITVCGGGANSEVWCQIFADALGKPIFTVEGGELGAKGAVMNNAVIQGYYTDYRDAVEKTVCVRKVYQPDVKRHEEYTRYYGLYKETCEALKKTWKLRSKIIEEEAC